MRTLAVAMWTLNWVKNLAIMRNLEGEGDLSEGEIPLPAVR